MIYAYTLQFKSQLTSSPAVIDNRLFGWGVVLPLSAGARDSALYQNVLTGY